MIRPKYPPDAVRQGMAGQVEVRVSVATDGRTKDIEVLGDDSQFSKSAVAAIRKWRFRPVTAEGHPTDTIYKVHVRFNPLLREANSDVEVESPASHLSLPPLPVNANEDNLGARIYRESDPGVIAPKQMYSPEPEFSEKARQAKEQGTVMIVLVVAADSLPQNVRVACSSAPDLNENAIEAVKRWKFAPGTKDGKPVPVKLLIEVSFKLDN
jgi:TonB family protein